MSPEALEVFRAADIAPERRGRARLERLTSEDRTLYDWILEDVLNFSESAESAERYLADRPEINGSWVSIPVAIEAGTAIFGDLLGRASGAAPLPWLSRPAWLACP